MTKKKIIKGINKNSTKKEVLLAVKQNPHYLLHANNTLKKDKEIAIAAVKHNARALDYVDLSLQKDKEILFAAVTSNNNPLNLIDTSHECTTDRKFILSSIKINPAIINHLGTLKALKIIDLTNDKEIFLTAIKNKYPNALSIADKTLKNDKEIVLETVKQQGLTLQYADKSLQKDKEIVISALENNPSSLEFADKTLKKDKEIVFKAVKKFCESRIFGYIDAWEAKEGDVLHPLQFADKSLQKDKDIVNFAITNCTPKYYIHFLDTSFRKNKKFLLEMIKGRINNTEEVITILMFVDKSLLKDKQFILTIFKYEVPSLQVLIYIDQSLLKNPTIINAAGYKNFEELKIAIEEYAYDWIKDWEWDLNFLFGSPLFRKNLLKNKILIKKIIQGYLLENKEYIIELELTGEETLGRILRYVDQSLLNDKDFILEIIEFHGFVLEFADLSLRKNKSVVLQAVKINGFALKFAHQTLRQDPEVVLAAIECYGYEARDIDEHFIFAEEILEYADKSLIQQMKELHNIETKYDNEFMETLTTQFGHLVYDY